MEDLATVDILEQGLLAGAFPGFRLVGEGFQDKFDEILQVLDRVFKGVVLVFDAEGKRAEELRDFLALARLGSQKQCFVVNHADSLSPQAIQAFLKALEEALSEVTFVLFDYSGRMPETVVSRCKSLFAERSLVFSKESQTIWSEFMEMSTSQRLLWAVKISEKSSEELMELLENFMGFLRKSFTLEVSSRLSLLDESLRALARNQNKKMVMFRIAEKW